MHKDERPPQRPDEAPVRVLASWRYAFLFSFLLTSILWLFAGLWIWLRDEGFHDADFLLITWALSTLVGTVLVRWDNRRW